LSFKLIDTRVRKEWYPAVTEGRKLEPDEAIADLNERFKEHGIGYQFGSNELIKVGSTLIHSEAVKPTLRLLGGQKRFAGANQEFLSAFEHYRHGRNKESLVDALKSFESVMKAICKKQQWPYDERDSAKKLIDICLAQGLIPAYLQSQFTSLRSLLESGVPTVRNRLGGHGQGTQTIVVTQSIASYALHLTASNVLFLTGLEKEHFS